MTLDIAGLMSVKSADEVTREHDNLYSAAKVLNITDKIDPFLSLAFLPLPVIPEVRITDSGLFDVINFNICGMMFYFAKGRLLVALFCSSITTPSQSDSVDSSPLWELTCSC